jgi:hypothetical protein
LKTRANKIRRPAPELTTELKAGRRALEGLRGVRILKDYLWDGWTEDWILHLELTPVNLVANNYIPETSEWFVSVSESYPRGKIKFKPASVNGLTATFPHQNINLPFHDQSKWRGGDLCLDKPNSIFGRQSFTNEPYEEDWRLQWHTLRALYWLEDASRNELLKPNDPFELPQFVVNPFLPERVIFVEGRSSFDVWESSNEQVGFVEFYVLSRVYSTYYIKAFCRLDGRPFVIPEWGYSITESIRRNVLPTRGIWIKLKEPPFVPPWQAPTTLGELRQVCADQNIDFYELLDRIYSGAKIADNFSKILVLGFPIPQKVGQDFERFHWQGLKLPELKVSDDTVPGFRSSGRAAVAYNRERVLHNDLKLDWLVSENWYPDQIRSRGTLPEVFTGKNILLIGAGSLGSMIGELLVRGGIDRMAIIDSDVLNAGNLVRHTLDLRHLNQNKAQTLAAKLNQISPFARIDAIQENFFSRSQKPDERIKECNMIIDCTGENDVLAELTDFQFDKVVQYVSLSVNLGAQRIYLYSGEGEHFDFDDFKQKIAPWMTLDKINRETIDMPSEGIGCWHPVFPARADDMWLFAPVAIKKISEILSAGNIVSAITVFEQYNSDDGAFSGLRLASLPEQTSKNTDDKTT